MLGSPSYPMEIHKLKTSIHSVFSVKTYRVRFFIILLESQLGERVHSLKIRVMLERVLYYITRMVFRQLI